MQCISTPALWTKSPGAHGTGFLEEGLWGDQDRGATHTLSNALVTYTLQETGSGLSLMSWQRAGSSVVWDNAERPLWRATVFDVDLAQELGVMVLEPCKEKQEWVTATSDGLAASWLVRVGTDELRVVIDLTLDEDRLLVASTLEWVGTPTQYAVDSFCAMPLRVNYREIGSDVACLGAIKGMSVHDPRYRFRYVPEDPDQPSAGWLSAGKNQGVTTSGKSLTLPCWGYYAESDLEGWGTWIEDRADEIHSGVFQSDGQRLIWEYWIPQPNWVQAGNDGVPMETATVYGLRPFLATSIYGWWDIADHYRQRLEANQPAWLTPKIQLDPDRRPIERSAAIWVDFDFGGIAASEKDEIEGAIDLVRTQLGVGTEVPVFGWIIGEPRESRPHMPNSPPLPGNNERAGAAVVHGNPVTGVKNAFLGIHKPANHWPSPLNEGIWGDGTQDWWEEWDGSGMYVIQRLAAIVGESPLLRGNNGTAGGDFYQEEDHVVEDWNASTLRARLEDTPGTFSKFFRWGGTGFQFTVGGLRYYAEVDSISSRNVFLKEMPVGHTGAQMAPPVGVACKLADLEDDLCHHAVLNSEVKAFLEEYVVRAQRDGWQQALQYMDVYPARSLRNKSLCSGTHSDWNRLLPGYTPHPSGGGNWWYRSVRDYFRTFYEAGRGQQSPGVSWLGCEYLDEVFFPYTHIGLHTAGYAKLWRTFNPHPNSAGYNDPDDHGIRPVPMFAVVHAGRCFSMQRAFSFGNGLLSIITRNDAFFPVDAPKFRAAVAWWMCGEWVWGLTPLSYTHTGNDALGVDISVNLWDPDQYTGASAADPDIASIRDLWVSLTQAEILWALSFLRNGQLLPPGDDEGSTLFDMQASGVFDETSASLGTIALSRRNDLPVVWDPKNQPRAVNGVWRASTGMSVCVFFLNWTDTSATAHWSYPFERYGLTGEVIVFRVSASGNLTRVGSFFDSYTYNRTVAAFTMQALLLAPENEVEGLSLTSDTLACATPQTHKITYWAPAIVLEVVMKAAGVPLDISASTQNVIRGILPGGADLTLPASLVTDGTDGRLFINLSGGIFRGNLGVWRLQGIVLIGGETFTGSFDQIVSELA